MLGDLGSPNARELGAEPRSLGPIRAAKGGAFGILGDVQGITENNKSVAESP